jgi:hypothetical protein
MVNLHYHLDDHAAGRAFEPRPHPEQSIAGGTLGTAMLDPP